MKAFYWFLALGLSGSVALAQSSGKTVRLVGIVDLGINCAVLEVTQTNHTRKYVDQLLLETNQSQSGIQLHTIDVSRGIVTAEVNGKTLTLAFNSPDSATVEKSSTIRLNEVKLQPVIQLYGQLKGRTVLQHPGLRNAGFTLTANPQSRPEAAKAFEELFASHQIAVIPDGEKFVMLVPIAITNRLSPHSNKVADAGPTIPPMSVNFQNVPMRNALQVYGEYTSHPVNNLQSSPFGLIRLVQENPMSKGQICYALETLLAWNGVRVITNPDNTSSWQHIP